MSLSSGADDAAGPSRLEVRGDHALAMARPLLLAVALWQFLERGRYPEVAVSCVFQLWRAHVARGRWPACATDLSGRDAEARAPPVLNSRTSAASFACIEQLGVRPPPAGGWVPREAKEDADVDGSAEGHTEWWSNVRDGEWIYHSAEDKYFHLPSNSLWERRDSDSCDPDASPHTYCRVDALHLQALSHFATSMDTALVPMAWKAWAQYTRRRTGRGRTLRPPPEPCEAEGSQEAASEGDAEVEWRSQLASGERTTPPSAAGADERAQGDAAFSRGQGSPDAAAGRGANAPADLAAEAELLDAAAASIVQLSAGQKAANLMKAPSLAVLTSTADSSELTKALQRADEESSLLGDGRRGWCLCFRVRGRSSRKRCMAYSLSAPTTVEATPKMAGAEVLAKSTAVTGRDGPAGDPHASAVACREAEIKDPPPPREATKLGRLGACEGVLDQHVQRLEQFLAEVKRNPQRLVTHVERRRAEKSAAAFRVL